MPARQNHALRVAYDGRPYLGFQPQGSLPTVGGTLASALRRLGIRATPFGASRTDARVQAFGQIASFQSRLAIEPSALLARLNDALPSTIRIRQAARAHPSFHAHWSALGKVYRYRIPARESARLDPRRLDFALDLIASREDLSAFSASRERDKHKVRTIDGARRLEHCPVTGILIEISGAGFGRYQIRNLVAAAQAMAAGQLGPDALLALARGEGPRPVKAAAEGLCLWQVRYASELDPFAGMPPGETIEPPFLSNFLTREELTRGFALTCVNPPS